MCQRRPPFSSPGFALVEVVVVLVCLALLTAGGVAAYQSIHQARASATIREIVALIEHAKRASRTCRLPFEVVFDEAAQRCGVRRVGDTTWYPAPSGAQPMLVELGTSATGGLVIKHARLPSGQTLRFDLEGAPAGSARIDLTDAAGQNYRVDVTATGMTSWSRP